jgi:hypothetical protein
VNHRPLPTLKPKRVINSPTRGHPVHVDLEGIADDGLGYTFTLYADSDQSVDRKLLKTSSGYSHSPTRPFHKSRKEKMDDNYERGEEIIYEKSKRNKFRTEIQQPQEVLKYPMGERLTSDPVEDDSRDVETPAPLSSHTWKESEYPVAWSRYTPQRLHHAKRSPSSPINPINSSNSYVWPS